jgi:hypothetical protein
MHRSSIRFVESYRKPVANIVDQRANLYRCLDLTGGLHSAGVSPGPPPSFQIFWPAVIWSTPQSHPPGKFPRIVEEVAGGNVSEIRWEFVAAKFWFQKVPPCAHRAALTALGTTAFPGAVGGLEREAKSLLMLNTM